MLLSVTLKSKLTIVFSNVVNVIDVVDVIPIMVAAFPGQVMEGIRKDGPLFAK